MLINYARASSGKRQTSSIDLGYLDLTAAFQRGVKISSRYRNLMRCSQKTRVADAPFSSVRGVSATSSHFRRPLFLRSGRPEAFLSGQRTPCADARGVGIDIILYFSQTHSLVPPAALNCTITSQRVAAFPLDECLVEHEG